jgi:hypothetical protein
MSPEHTSANPAAAQFAGQRDEGHKFPMSPLNGEHLWKHVERQHQSKPRVEHSIRSKQAQSIEDLAAGDPTEAPTAAPTEAPTSPPTEAPTAPPTEAPSGPPTEAPTDAPFEDYPTYAPYAPPTYAPFEMSSGGGGGSGSGYTPTYGGGYGYMPPTYGGGYAYTPTYGGGGGYGYLPTYGSYGGGYYYNNYYNYYNNYYNPYGSYGGSYGSYGSYFSYDDDYYYTPAGGSTSGETDTDDAWWNIPITDPVEEEPVTNPGDPEEPVEEPVIEESLRNVYSVNEADFADYYSPGDDYYMGVSADDFTPVVQENVDNGKIFAFGKDAAMKLHASTNGDLYVVTKSYKAMIDTIVGEAGPGSSFKKDFALLGKGTADTPVPGGMAMLAFEVYGGDNREVSTYAFQPGITPAFYNTFYNARTMFLLSKYPPTLLVETYYTCVLSQWMSFYQAAGLANSNVQLYLTVAFMAYMYMLVFYQTKVLHNEIKFKSAKEKEAQKMEEHRQEVLDEVIQHFSIMRYRFDALVEDSKAGDKDFSGFNMAIAMSEIKDLDMIRSATQVMEVVNSDSAKGLEGIELTETGFGNVVRAEDIKDFEQVRQDCKTDDNV